VAARRQTATKNGRPLCSKLRRQRRWLRRKRQTPLPFNRLKQSKKQKKLPNKQADWQFDETCAANRRKTSSRQPEAKYPKQNGNHYRQTASTAERAATWRTE